MIDDKKNKNVSPKTICEDDKNMRHKHDERQVKVDRIWDILTTLTHPAASHALPLKKL